MLTTQFLVTSLIVVLMPGTGTLYTISTGLTRGWRAGVAAAAGCTLGIVPHLCASALGLSAIMNMGAHAFAAIKLAGAAYLLYLAWQMWRDTGPGTFERDPAPARGGLAVAWRAVALNLLNPKLTVFFLAFLPQFVDPRLGPKLAQLAGLSGVFMVMTLVVFCLYALLAAAARRLFDSQGGPMRLLRRSFAVVFAGLAVQLAVAER